MIFSYARGPFLEFLRNLTPQILLFSIAIILGSKLDINKIDISNTLNSIPFILVVAVFFSAAIANMFMFIENSCKSVDWIDEKSKKFHKKGIKGWRHLRYLSVLLWRNSKIFFVEIVVAILIVQVGFSAVFLSSIQAATNLYKVINGG